MLLEFLRTTLEPDAFADAGIVDGTPVSPGVSRALHSAGEGGAGQGGPGLGETARVLGLMLWQLLSRLLSRLLLLELAYL